jgi:hypothetical protein
MVRLVQHCFDFTFVGRDRSSDILMTRRSDGASVRLRLGSDNWRAIKFTAFRANSENVGERTPELPWDTQVYIQNLVWEDEHVGLDGEASVQTFRVA